MFRHHVVCSLMADHASSVANEEEQVVQNGGLVEWHKGDWQNDGFDGSSAAD